MSGYFGAFQNAAAKLAANAGKTAAAQAAANAAAKLKEAHNAAVQGAQTVVEGTGASGQRRRKQFGGKRNKKSRKERKSRKQRKSRKSRK